MRNLSPRGQHAANPPMRIAQVAPLAESVPPSLYGGTERVVSWLTEELVALGHKVTLFASGDSKTNAKPIPAWPKALRLSRRFQDPFAGYASLMEAVAQSADQFDLIHCHLLLVGRGFGLGEQIWFRRTVPAPHRARDSRLNGGEDDTAWERGRRRLVSFLSRQRKRKPFASQQSLWLPITLCRRTDRSSSSDFLHYLSVSEQGSAAQDISNENGNEKVQQQLPVPMKIAVFRGLVANDKRREPIRGPTLHGGPVQVAKTIHTTLLISDRRAVQPFACVWLLPFSPMQSVPWRIVTRRLCHPFHRPCAQRDARCGSPGRSRTPCRRRHPC